MSDVENSRSIRNVDKGSGGDSPEVLEVKTEKELKSIVKDKQEKEKLKKEWQNQVKQSKEKFKRRLVGGKKEHKDKLEQIIKKGKIELRRIESLSGREQKKALKDLQKDQEREINKLIKNVEKDSGEINDRQASKLSNKEEATKEVWVKLLILE